MYLSIEQVIEALKHLETMHTFFGTTFLVLKAHNLPIGRTIDFPLIQKDKEFLTQYYKPYTQSQWYYRVSRTSAGGSQHWLSPKFPGGGLQKVRSQDPLKRAFLHPKDSSMWGWQTNYIDVLRSCLYRGDKVAAFHLAVWLYREREWPDETTGEDILWTFIDEFQVSQEEVDALFDVTVPEPVRFQQSKITWKEFLAIIDQMPPDAEREQGGTLVYLQLRGIGPAPELEFEPAERINLITGDNGLGKTFLLECAWWALTGLWSGLPAHPYVRDAYITYQIAGEFSKSKKTTLAYDWQRQSWPPRPIHETVPGLLIYARTDNSFAVWDPARLLQTSSGENVPEEVVFSPNDVWDGKQTTYGGRSRFISNGLISDWVKWQNSPTRHPFDTLRQVLNRLSPSEFPLQPGEPTRLPNDARDMPTLRLPYGDVPLVHAAAGMRRIVSLAYMIVWAWNEHLIQSEATHKRPEQRMVVIVDEIEAHLHPRWQRLIAPAMLEVQQDLDENLQMQFFITTHSPLVTASVEPSFDATTDKLFKLDLVEPGVSEQIVRLEEMPFIKHGSSDAWVTSDVFGLEQARSVEAEQAIEAAKALQLDDNPNSENVRRVHADLVKYLAQDDAFWPRWIWFAEQYGVGV